MWLTVLHQLFSVLILTSSVTLPTQWMFWLQTIILASWLVFNGCILGQIEHERDPEGQHTKGSLARILGVTTPESKRTLSVAIDALWYTNYIFLSYRVGLFEYGIAVLMLYFVANGRFSSPGE